MITLQNITVSFGTKTVLHNLSGTIDTGDFVVVVGSNGTGKSTLFDTIAGVIKPTTGSVLFDGRDVTHQNAQQRSLLVSRLFQDASHNSVGTMTVAENLALAALKTKQCSLRTAMNNFPYSVKPLLTALYGNSKELLQTPMNKLSGGQRQTIALLMATLTPPKILLLDEPTAALDPQAATQVLRFTKDFVTKHKITTLLITHDPLMAQAIGNKLWVLDKGKIAHYYGAEKRNLEVNKLIGHIDYESLQQNN